MNHISDRHRRMVERLQAQDVLTDPEKYFGPNYKTLLNFWIYWESLSLHQKSIYTRRENALDYATWRWARSAAEDLAVATVGEQTRNGLSYYDLEIVAADLLIDSGIPLTFIPLLETNDSL